MGISRSFGNSLPHAPSDQFRPETAFLLVCDGGLGRYVQVLLRDFVVGFHALPLVLQPTLFLCTSACCFHVLRADSIAVATAVTPSARCAWSVFLPAVGYALLFLGSWVPSLAVSVLGFLGPFPGCFFLLFSRCRCHFDSTEFAFELCSSPWLKASLCTSHCDEVKRILSCSRRQLRRELHSPWHRCCCFLASLPASPCP